MKSYVFVSDAFAENFQGGAELTTEALLRSGLDTKKIIKILSRDVTAESVEKFKNSHWICS